MDGKPGDRNIGLSGLQPQSRVPGRREERADPGVERPGFRGDRTRYNPEELLVGTLSTCHMLWVLHLCADAGLVVTEYADEALGEMIEHADGSGEFTRVLLRPRMRIADAARVAEAVAIHHRAHQLCFLARSMRFAVEHQPVVLS